MHVLKRYGVTWMSIQARLFNNQHITKFCMQFILIPITPEFHVNFNSSQGQDAAPSAMSFDEGDVRLNDIVLGVVCNGSPPRTTCSSDGS